MQKGGKIRQPGASGFTLIELMVVITIILILAAILFEVFAAANEKAYQNNCLSNLKNIGTAIQQYISDYDNTMLATGGTSSTPAALSCTWYSRLMSYITTKSLIYNDLDSTGLSKWGTTSGFPEIFSCPSVPELAVGYGMNYQCTRGIAGLYPSSLIQNEPPFLTYTAPFSVIKAPASTIYICEAGEVATGAGSGTRGDPKGASAWVEVLPSLPDPQTNPPTIGIINDRSVVLSSRQICSPRCRIPATGFNTGTISIYVPRHNGGTNCLMLDGHVKCYSIKELDKWRYRNIGSPGVDDNDGIPELGEPGCPWDNVPD